MAITLATQNSKLTGKIRMKLRYLFVLWCVLNIGWVQAGEVLSDEAPSDSVRALLLLSVSDMKVAKLQGASQRKADIWLNEMSPRLQKRMPDSKYRLDFLSAVYYEATRAGLEPALVLGLIEVKSNFNKHSVSPAGAQGYMHVMPFWVKAIGKPDHDDLFNMRTNLRYGCTILRNYLGIENGDMYRALGRYDGSLGKPEFPNLVRAAWKENWGMTSP